MDAFIKPLSYMEKFCAQKQSKKGYFFLYNYFIKRDLQFPPGEIIFIARHPDIL